ncbi:MAG: DUF3467 domain-containing protein [Candidatus Sulfotelmatobacter sp.]
MDAEATPKPQKQIEYRTPQEGMLRVYCNNFAMATTSFDVRLVFGEVAEIKDDKVIVDQNVQVTMTWLEAKILADFLQANVKAHEEINGGAMKLPKNPEQVIVPNTFGS